MNALEAETLAEVEKQEREAGEEEREARKDVRKRKREVDDATEECMQAERVQRLASERLKEATAATHEARTKVQIARGRRAHLRQRVFLHPEMVERQKNGGRAAMALLFREAMSLADANAWGAYAEELGLEVTAYGHWACGAYKTKGNWGYLRAMVRGAEGEKPDYVVWVRYALEEVGVDELTGELNGGWEATLQAEIGGEVVCTMHAYSDDAPCYKVCVLDDLDARNRIAPRLQKYLPGPDYALNKNGQFLRALVQEFPWVRLATGAWLLGAGPEVVAPIGFALPDGFGKPLN